jgi:uncharacterized protein
MSDQTVESAKAFLGTGWAFPVQADRATGDVAMAAYEEDVRQAIRLILETELGERVMRPDFGAGLRSLVFEPLNTTTMALIRHRVEQALITWEPRIDVEEVRVTTDVLARNRLDVHIGYRVRAVNTFYNLVFPFYLREGEP